MTVRDKTLGADNQWFALLCVINVMCHECQEGFPIWEAGEIRLIVNIKFILYYAQFLHTEKKLMTLLTHDTHDTQKKIEKSCSKIRRAHFQCRIFAPSIPSWRSEWKTKNEEWRTTGDLWLFATTIPKGL